MRNVSFVSVLLCGLLASACGQKGPLVLPDAQKQRSAKPAVPSPAAAPAVPSSVASEAHDPGADAAPASAPVH
jgi:predicted small lipoprotein YifL